MPISVIHIYLTFRLITQMLCNLHTCFGPDHMVIFGADDQYRTRDPVKVIQKVVSPKKSAIIILHIT